MGNSVGLRSGTLVRTHASASTWDTEIAGILAFASDIPLALYQQLQRFCFKNEIRIFSTFRIGDILTRAPRRSIYIDKPLMLSHNSWLCKEKQAIKRITICSSREPPYKLLFISWV
jgi:hypothetical protein